jgi:predicted Zn-dependent protease with MMP-like domain
MNLNIMNRERFEKLVAQAVEALPEEFQEKLENFDVVVEDYPSSAQLRKANLGKGFTLLGLYEGVPLTRRQSNYGMVPPDKITIFQKAIEIECRGTDDINIKTEIQKVVRHEIAHHFGIGDARLKQIEDEKSNK